MSALPLPGEPYGSFPEAIVVVPLPPISPGASINVSWVWSQAPVWISHIGIEILLGSAVVCVATHEGAASGNVHVPPPSDPLVASQLYKIGTKQLTVKVTDLVTGASAVGTCSLIVNQPPIDGWWAWLHPPHDPILWKTEYDVGGELMNHSQATLRVLQADIWQRGPDGDGLRLSVPLPGLDAPPGHPLRLVKERIRQDWHWFKEWKPGYEKTFTYTLDVELADEFGNRYLLRQTPPKLVRIQVSDDKRAWGYLDAVLKGVAIGFTLGGVWIGDQALRLAKKAFGSVASDKPPTGALGAGVRAEDPPFPDPEYKQRIGFEPEAPETNVGDLQLPAAAIAEINTVITGADVLARIENKWLGALAFGDADAAHFQRTDYLALLGTLRGTADGLASRVELLRGIHLLARADVPLLDVWRQQGIPAEQISLLQQSGLPPELLQLAASAFVAQGSASLPEEGLGPLIAQAAEIAVAIVANLVLANPESASSTLEQP